MLGRVLGRAFGKARPNGRAAEHLPSTEQWPSAHGIPNQNVPTNGFYLVYEAYTFQSSRVEMGLETRNKKFPITLVTSLSLDSEESAQHSRRCNFYTCVQKAAHNVHAVSRCLSHRLYRAIALSEDGQNIVVAFDYTEYIGV